MTTRFFRTFVYTVLIFISVSHHQVVASESNTTNAVHKRVNEIVSLLQKENNPEAVFSVSLNGIPDNEVHAKPLDPGKWIPQGEKAELNRYVGALAFVRISAPFFKVSRSAISYSDESKFTPGILSTKIVDHKRLSNENEVLILERERDLPLTLRPFFPTGSRYRLSNTLISKTDSWLSARIALISSLHHSRNLLKSLEGFEFYQKLSDGKTLVFMGVFALPNTGALASKKDFSVKIPNPLSKVTLGVLDKVVSTLDVRDKLYSEVSKAVVDGAYQNAVGLTQITTDPRWKSKWTYQLTGEESKQILTENKAILEKAKKNKWIEYELH